ncbi:hypothetical protein BEWA_030150 [Theileria equi strain WA]|uniref:Protein kinase domain-containing protein n=1 Tax=Theileria equi strain WA TaxID=1537102 RepID=L0AY21_THEEQ|nr:hypothetical protein BEWA_030150 [Theileria equi strain WA]AFZ80163.1 hypothetical protein BEWA_030150 [Theileria equi strain WA]|eukprot:XP_004829829.1 hypothetical protein BEWA_030150 [Theileria equi strain WA]
MLVSSDCSLVDQQMLQIEEIYAIHCIYFPVKIINPGKLDWSKFPDDCMSDAEYKNLSVKSKFRTDIKVGTVSIKDVKKLELIRFSFVVSENLESDLYSIIEVTFPKDYPVKPPLLTIKMTISLPPEEREHLVNEITDIIKRSSGNICIFDISVCVCETMNRVSNDHKNLWQEMTVRQVHSDDSSDDEQHVNRVQQGDSPRENVSESITKSSNDGRLDSVNTSSSKLLADVKIARIPLPTWSAQSLIQSPLWYEKKKGTRYAQVLKNDSHEYNKLQLGTGDISSFLDIPVLSLHENALNISNIESIDMLSNEVSSFNSVEENSGAFTEQDDLTEELDLIALSNKSIIISAIQGYLIQTKQLIHADRYKRDFVESLSQDQPCYRLSVAKHILDQNLYSIKSYDLPHFCSFNSLGNFSDGRIIFHHLSFRRRLIVNELISKISGLAKLQHNSISRYYQCWLEKDVEVTKIDELNLLCQSVLDGTFDTKSHKKYTRQLLLKVAARMDDTDEITDDFLLSETITQRRLFIQMQHFEGRTLEQEIQNNNLYKDEKLLWSFIRHLLDVLAYLHHHNAYHLRLSPDNIIVTSDSYGTGLKVCEFGIVGSLRQLYNFEYQCKSPSCGCRISRNVRDYLYEFHPSSYGLDAPAGDQDYDAEQEDMFAFGLIIFKMWHPPTEESQMRDIILKVVSSRTFPQYFIQSTPQIIITTLIRLFSNERRPTATELLRETLVPPVMDIYLYKQYLRRLQNPLSEESMDAVKFLFSRDWKSNVTRLKGDTDVEYLAHASHVVDRLETFMSNRSVVIRPPLIMQPSVDGTGDDVLLVLDSNNAILYLVRNILQSLLKAFQLNPDDKSGLGFKQFSAGDIYFGDKCALSAAFGITLKLDNVTSTLLDGQIKRNFDDTSMLIAMAQVELVSVAVDSLKSLDLRISLMISFSPLMRDFLSLVLGVEAEISQEIISKLCHIYINEYNLKMLLGNYSIACESDVVRALVDLFSSSYNLPVTLYKLHSLAVLLANFSQDNSAECTHLLKELSLLKNDSCSVNTSGEISTKGISDAYSTIQDQYLKRIRYMLELSKFLEVLGYTKYCFMELVSDNVRLKNFCEHFPLFCCYMDDYPNKYAVAVGGCYDSSLYVSEGSTNILHFGIEYIIEELVATSKRGKRLEGYAIAPTKSNVVDVIITSQTVRLLPAAVSIANKLIDAGLSCECRAIPLVLTNHFNERLQMINGVKARVHLQKSSNVVSTPLLSHATATDAIDEPMENLTPGEHKSSSDLRIEEAESVSKINLAEFSEGEDGDRSAMNIIYHVEPVNGSFSQAKKMESETSLVHFLIGQLL